MIENNVEQVVEKQLPPISPQCQSVKEAVSNNTTSVRHSKIAELFRRSTSNQLQCSMFCGGRKCKYDLGSVWSDKDKAIPVIYSHWVTNNILAMARPNTEMIEQLNLIDLFKKENIRTIINLQEPGEHANCGPTLEETSEFTYDPKVFMDNDIYFYNFKWKDFSDIGEDALVDMVKVIIFSLLQGKVAIHCHAGLGRTGTLIAAYLIFTYRCQPQNAINFVRSRRPKSIQTRNQISILFKFANYISPCFIVYSKVTTSIQIKTTLKEFLHRQNLLLHGSELRILRYIPKIVFIICEKLIHLSTPSKGDSNTKNEVENFTFKYLSYKNYQQIEVLINKTSSVNSPVRSDSTSSKEDFDQNFVKEIQSINLDEQLIDSLVDGDQISMDSPLQNEILGEKSLDQSQGNFIFETDALLNPKTDRNLVTKQKIIETLIGQPKSDHELIITIYDYQKEINNNPSGWNRLRNEKDVELLCALLLSWLEDFDTPILDEQVIEKIENCKGNYMQCFHSLDHRIRYTIEYLIRFIIKLNINQTDICSKRRLIMRLIASLTMKKLRILNEETIPTEQMKPTWTYLISTNRIIEFIEELIKVILIHDQ